jgi:hypothetical protein
MSTNPYFNFYNNKAEQSLVENLMVEAVRQYGFTGYYVPNDNPIARDLLYGDDPLKQFSAAYPLELYLSNATSYDGEQEFFSKFGMEIRNSVSVMLAKRIFEERVPKNVYSRPIEGDLIYIPFTGSSGKGELYEIKFVQGNKDMFVLGRKNPYFYELKLELFKYSQEIIETGVSEIDIILDDSHYNVPLMLNKNTGTGDFLYREVVYQSADGTFANNTTQAIVSSWDASIGQLNIVNTSGSFTANSIIYGETSNAHYVLISTNPTETSHYDNNHIQTEANTIINTSETNPFGSIGGS